MKHKLNFEKGYIEYRLYKNELYLSDVWVDEEYRGFNYARKAITFLLIIYPNVDDITLISAKSSKKYWKHQGFKAVSKSVGLFSQTRESFLNGNNGAI